MDVHDERLRTVRKREEMSPRATPASVPCPPGCVNVELTSRIIAAASDLALYLDEHGVIQDVSIGEAIQSSPGWTQLLGKKWIDTITRESRGKVEHLLEEARAGAASRPREINQNAEGTGEVPFR